MQQQPNSIVTERCLQSISVSLQTINQSLLNIAQTLNGVLAALSRLEQKTR